MRNYRQISIKYWYLFPLATITNTMSKYILTKCQGLIYIKSGALPGQLGKGNWFPCFHPGPKDKKIIRGGGRLLNLYVRPKYCTFRVVCECLLLEMCFDIFCPVFCVRLGPLSKSYSTVWRIVSVL